MRFTIIRLVIQLLSLICFAQSGPSPVDDGDKSSSVQANCNFKCTRERQPICATSIQKRDYQMFENFCELLLFNCNTNDDYRKVDMEMCFSKDEMPGKSKMITSRLVAE